VAVSNGRGNRGLRKLWRGTEAVLRGAVLRNGRYFDQLLYTIVVSDWRQSRAAERQLPRVMVQ
jgi:hypothetical protein